MSKRLLVLLPAAGLVVGLLSGCVQMPTEKQGVSDLRPQLSFKVADENLRAARVMVDGLDMGAVGDYVEGTAVLRVLSGIHVVRIYASGMQILEEKIYVGDGVNRAILVK